MDRSGARARVRPAQGALVQQRAEIAHGLGDLAGEREYREQTVAQLTALPEGQRADDQLEHAKAALAALGAPQTDNK